MAAFQSSPGSEPGATVPMAMGGRCPCSSFQSSPGSEPGATCGRPVTRANSACFNPHPALSRVPPSGRGFTGARTRWFQSSPGSEPGATAPVPCEVREFARVSILTRL